MRSRTDAFPFQITYPFSHGRRSSLMTVPPIRSTLARLNDDLFASIVAFLVALPLCMGIAVASGAPPAAGLISGIIGGLLVGALAGCPLQVSGPAAGLIVIVWDLIRTHGMHKLGIIILVAGALQLVVAMLQLAQWFCAVSPAVIQAAARFG